MSNNQTQNVKILNCDPSALGLFSWGTLLNYSHVLMIPKDKTPSVQPFLAPTHFSGLA